MKGLRKTAVMVLMGWSSAFAAFESSDLSSESVKIGEASTSLVLGAENIYANPAGLAGLKKRVIGLLYSRMLLNLAYDELSYFDLVGAYPLKDFTPAFSFNRFSSRLYYEQIFSFAGALKLLSSFDRTFSLGFRLKMLQIGYSQNEYTSLDSLFAANGYTKSGISVDMGVLYESQKGFKGGICFKNIVPPDMTLAKTGAAVPFVFNAGASYLWDWNDSGGFVKFLLLACDTSLKNEDFSVHLGVETGLGSGEFVPGAGVVIGTAEMGYISAGFSYRPKRSLSGSVIDHLQTVGYAFRFHFSGMYLGTYGDHFLSLSFWF